MIPAVEASVQISTSHALALIHQMVNASPPLVFWSGYSTVVLVSFACLQSWSVIVSESPRVQIFPRRWCNMYGVRVDDLWEAALRAVIGVVLFRPGVSQVRRLLDKLYCHFHCANTIFLRQRFGGV